ncbi:esterase/lipase superfamily enzyme [Bosea sp. 124]|nr:esterase/lipase superfamily enzyme [Bosea sp. 124]
MPAGGATIALANPQPGLPPQPYVLPQPNPSQVAPSVGAKDARIVEFLFATNRSRPDPSRPTEFSFGRMPSLTLGAVRVRVPEDHKIGRIELPGNYKVLSFTIWKDEFQKEKHFKVDHIVTINRERWLEQISSNPDGEVLIFVHGFNTTFEDSVYRAAQIAWDLQYPGTMILFSWPSRGNSVAHYDYDQNSALNARDRFLDLVTLVQTETKTKRVHVIAHSMGNRVVVDALANYGKTTNPRKINELIMASPDIDQDLFLGQISDLEKVTAGMTLYASSTDKAMIAARNVSKAPKAGDFNQNKIMELKTVDLIDTSAIGEEMFGLNHTSFAERRSLINDIKLIIRRGLRPPNERLPEIRGMPPGVTGRPSFWRFVL